MPDTGTRGTASPSPTDPEAPVSDPALFVGQTGIVRRIFSRVGADRPQSVAVIGGKKSGKTSLLAYLGHASVRGKLLEGAERYAFVSGCSACGPVAGPDAFLGEMHKILRPGTASGGNAYEAVRAAVEEQHAAGKRIVVLLDDFHSITSDERYPLEFFSFLRSLANNYNLAYVTTSFLELQKLCVIKDVEESPFFNIFTNLSLGMLSPADAERLAGMVLGGDGAMARTVAAWCGGSPYAIKTAAAALAGAAAPKEADLQKAVLPRLVPYFAQVLAILPGSAARPLQAVAKGKKPSAQDAHLLASLVKQGFLAEEGESLSCSSPAFADFLGSSFEPSMLQGRA
jgi:hypothetical protein